MLLQLSDVAINIEDRNILSGVSFCLDKGQVVQFSGSNGCGKTTLMRSIIGEFSHSFGDIIFDESLSLADDFLFIGDKYYLNDSLTVYENLLYLLTISGYGVCGDLSQIITNDKAIRNKIDNKINEALCFWDIGDFANEFPRALSLGQRKKVVLCLINILKSQRKIFILDEPANALDRESVAKLKGLIKDLKDNNEKSFIISNHGGKLFDDLQEVSL